MEPTEPPSPEIRGSKIPNLLHSGLFPPPPHSPTRHPVHLASAHPYVSSPVPSYPSPAAPRTPLFESFLPSSAMPFQPPFHAPPSPPSSPDLPSRLASLSDDPAYQALLSRALDSALDSENRRVDALLRHEAEACRTVEDLRRALARERRHSARLALELARHELTARYVGCVVHGAAEIDEEARVNAMRRSFETDRRRREREMNEEKGRVIFELEREEERMVMGLMERLEGMGREKALLERRIMAAGGIAGTMGDAGESAGFGSERQEREASKRSPGQGVQNTGDGRRTDGAAVAEASADEREREKNDENVEEEEDDEENGGYESDNEEDADEEDVLEGKHHDPEMEKELENLLKMKSARRENRLHEQRN